MSTRAPEAKPLKAFTVPVRPATSPSPNTQKIVARNLNFYYGAKRALEAINISISANLVTAFIGPSGCGKSTFLRTLNRMNDIIAGARVEGDVEIDGRDIYAQANRRRGAPATRRHGVPEVESLSEVDFREHRLRSAAERHGRQPLRAARARGREPACRRHLGRGEGSHARVGAGDVRRPAAAVVHRAGTGGQAGSAADGRTGVGARSDRDPAHRRADLPAQDVLHDRHRDAQHAAGGAGLRPDRLFLARTTG